MSRRGLRTVLITGASSGLGMALATLLRDRDDLRLILTARAESLPRFRQEGFLEGERIHLRAMRVNTEEERKAVVEEIDDCWGGVDVLINNAGVAYRSVVEHLEPEEIERQMQINFEAPLQLARLVLPRMREKRSGRIINVSSVGGMMAMPTMAPYSASKYALEGGTEALWYEVRPWNIQVTLVRPGFIRSSSFRNTRLTKASQEAFDEEEDPYHAHYRKMDALITRFMTSALATPESVARKIEQVMERERPPLRVNATLDAHVFALLRRFLPREMFHWVLYLALPQVRKWGMLASTEDRPKVWVTEDRAQPDPDAGLGMADAGSR